MVYFRIWRFILSSLALFHLPIHVLHLKQKDEGQRLLNCLPQTLRDMHMYVCERSRHWCALCEGRTVLGFQIRTQKFLVISDSLFSVFLRRFRRYFLISNFPLNMAPLDVIKIIYFLLIAWVKL